MSEHFDTVNLKASQRNKPVIAINLCGFRNEGNVRDDDDGSLPVNHWTMSLQHEDTSSESVDLKPRYDSDGWRAVVEIASSTDTSKDDAVMASLAIIKELSFPTITTTTTTTTTPTSAYVTVESVINLITSKGRQRYMFTNAVQGCRFWNWNLIVDMEAAGFVSAGSASITWDAMAYYYRDPDGGRELRPLEKGAFY